MNHDEPISQQQFDALLSHQSDDFDTDKPEVMLCYVLRALAAVILMGFSGTLLWWAK